MTITHPMRLPCWAAAESKSESSMRREESLGSRLCSVRCARKCDSIVKIWTQCEGEPAVGARGHWLLQKSGSAAIPMSGKLNPLVSRSAEMPFFRSLALFFPLPSYFLSNSLTPRIQRISTERLSGRQCRDSLL